MAVPLFDAWPMHEPLAEELLAAVERVLRSGRFILGPEVEAFEAALSKTLGCAHAVGVSSGSDALLACLMALDMGPGAEVVVPAYSFFATVGCVLRVGATPRFVDIDPTTLNAEADALLAAVTPQTRAVIAVPLFGRPIEGLERVAERVPLIEDNAQAMGAAPLRGLAACYSFFPTKNLGALGDGGAVVTQDAAFAERLRRTRAHGSGRKYHHDEPGGNFRLDALQAALLSVKLPHLPAHTAARRQLAERYIKALPPGLTPQTPHASHVYHQFVVRSPRRDALRAALGAAGIGTEVYYPLPLHRQGFVEARKGRQAPCPEADALSTEALALPCYPGLTEAAQREVIEAASRACAALEKDARLPV